MLRYETREVKVGKVGIGGTNSIRIQSMTTSNTRDVEATIDQVMKLVDWGCEIVRLTVQGKKEAEACELIKNGLLKRGYDVPLVADIHFYPPAALLVADFVEKIRVNPGNYADKRASFKEIEYTEASYQAELQRIEEKFTPLVQKCKQLKRAIRIGTNHGSLSDRIMNRYGDTPAGMVESALEYARVCRMQDYHDIIFSMKSSNPQVMIHAYRLLVARMEELGWNYPLHLGVTEAGEGEDGRIKSAMGIGSLLLEGLGDTVRVSLTEDPWFEIDPCTRLIHFAETSRRPEVHQRPKAEAPERRKGQLQQGAPLHRDGSVIAALCADNLEEQKVFSALGFEERGSAEWKATETAVDAVWVEDELLSKEGVERLKELQALGVGVFCSQAFPGAIPVLDPQRALDFQAQAERTQRFSTSVDSQAPAFAVLIQESHESSWEPLKNLYPMCIFLSVDQTCSLEGRRFFRWLSENSIETPVILTQSYSCGDEDLIIQASAECGALLCDGLGDGVCFRGRQGLGLRRRLGFQILQAARMRTFKTEFISCPSCGRTLFNLQTVSRQIRERTGHLPGVKIAVMGCIVNGPGEMADADFGYVGSAAGMIDLYVGKERVEKNIPAAEGPDRLVELLKREGRWVEPLSIKTCV